MKDERHSPKRSPDLRTRAEEKIRCRVPNDEDISGLSHEAIPSFVPDVKVHQVGLEMQDEALRQDRQQQGKVKLDALLTPRDQIPTLELGDIIDVQAIQSIMDDFFNLTGIGLGILDIHGKVLVATGWRDICTRFHRVHPETCKHCLESDTVLSEGVETGTFRLYKCKNNMWDIATPITVGEEHVGNLFLGQFFFEDESLDYEVFRSQARKYGFDKDEYLAALGRVPRWSREKIETVMSFYSKFACMISELSHSNVRLARTLGERDNLLSSLRESRRGLEEAQRLARIGNWEWDLRSGEVYWSDEIYRILGLSPCEHHPSYDLAKAVILPEDTAPWESAVREALESKDHFRLDYRAVRSDGQIIWIHNDARVIRDAEGNALMLEGIAQDVTDRKEAEEERRKSEERYRRFVETANEGIWSLDGDYVTTFVNTKMAEMLGYTTEEMTGRPASEFMFEEDVEAHAQRRRQRARGETGVYERRFRRKDGGEIWTRVSVTPLIDEHGSFQGSFAMLTDITELKRSEQRLKESEQRYRGVVDNIEIGISVLNPAMEIVAVNREAQRRFPHVRQGCGQKCFEQHHDPPRAAPCSHCPCVLTFQDGKTHEAVSETSVGGQIRHYSLVASPIKDASGRVEYVIELAEDITEKRALQAQLAQAQKMEAVGTLAGGIAHDFNNLLQIVSGHAELLEEELGERGFRFEELDAIRQAAGRGADLVRQILTFSRKLDSKFRPINLNTLVNRAERLLYRTIPKMIDIELRLDDNLKPIHADTSQMEQMLLNLAVNAKDAMPNGGKLIFETANVYLDENYCRSHPECTPGEYVCLKVVDTGRGMKEEVLDHLFEPFFTTKGLGEGTGLGLAMVFGIVKMHGGHIECESEPGKGSTFSICFPAITHPYEESETQHMPVPKGGTETILVVDDEELIRRLAKKIIERAGYTVLTAASGRDAIEVYKKERATISLIILDLIMPEIGGNQCLDELLKIDPQVKVILASGYDIEGETETIIGTGSKGSVSKPFNAAHLLRSIRKVLDEV